MTKRPDEGKRSRRELQTLIASVQDYAIFTLDRDGLVTSWNSGARAIKGYEEDEIIGQHFSRFYTPEDREAGLPERLLAQAARDGRVKCEGQRVRKDGSRFWADVVITALRDRNGELTGYLKVTRDVSERKHIEQERDARTRQQAAIAEIGLFALRVPQLQPVLERVVAQVAATLAVPLCYILELEPGGKLLLRAGVGFGPGMVGRARITADPKTYPACTLASREPTVLEGVRAHRHLRAPGLLRDHVLVSSVSAVVFSPDDTRPYGILAAHAAEPRAFSADDVHFLQAAANVVANAIARSHAEQQMRIAEREATLERQRTARAEEAVLERDEFLAVAAHELRTPLTALQLKLEGTRSLLAKGPAGPETASRVARRVADANRQAQRLTMLVERLLDVTRMASGGVDIDAGEMDLGELVRAVVSDFREQALVASSDVQVCVEGDAKGIWDAHHLEQVVSNLLSNALKYGAGLPIEIAVRGLGESVQLSVHDRGIGVATYDAERIFGRFERAAPVQNYGGLGLGLYIARHIVQAHGGTIRVLNPTDDGATFLVELPRHPAASHAGPQHLQADKA